MNSFKFLIKYYIIGNHEFSLKDLCLNEGYNEFLNISTSYDDIIRNYEKLILFYFGLVYILYSLSDNILINIILIKSLLIIFFSYIGYKFFKDSFKRYVGNFIKFCKIIVKYENYVKTLIKFPNFNISCSKINANKQEEETIRFIYVELKNLFDHYIKFMKRIKNGDLDNLVHRYLLATDTIKLETNNDLLSFYRILTDLKRIYIQHLCKTFVEIFSKKLACLFVFQYYKLCFYNNSLETLISFLDNSLNNFNDFFIESNVNKEFNLKSEEESKHKRLNDIQLETLSFYRKMTTLVNNIDLLDKEEQSKSIQNLFNDMSSIYINFKVFKENYIIKSHIQKDVLENNPQREIEDNNLSNHNEMRPHLLELNIQNRDKKSGNKEIQQFSFNHIEMIKMEKESKLAQQEMLCELDEIFRSYPKKSYTLEELLE